MDHDHFGPEFAERYQRGNLSREDETLFEDHFMNCAECQQHLLLARSFGQGLKALAIENALQQEAVRGLFAWLAQRGRGVQAGILTAFVLLALAPALWLLQSQGRPSHEHSAFSPVVALLQVHRDGIDDPLTTIDLTAIESTVLLAVDAGGDPRFETFQITILDTARSAQLYRGQLVPNALEVLMVSIPADLLQPGDYQLQVQGVPSHGPTIDLGSYPFRTIKPLP